MTNKSIALIVIAAGAVAVALFFGAPASEAWPLKCPLYQMTGWQCPLCGMQRAIHEMMHGNVGAAWGYNPALWVSLPYFTVLGVAAVFPHTRRCKAVCWAGKGSTFLFVAMLLMIWGVVRNLI